VTYPFSATRLERAGVFSIVIEYTVANVAEEVTREVSVLTICIGGGPHCDGQVLVLHDVLGLAETPLFAKVYVDLKNIIVDAVRRYVEEVKTGVFSA